mgnify:CR=1 FL=1
MTLFLCGFMGCGKTALGKALAKRLELPLVDMDDLIVEREGMTIPEIFDQKGEPYFRKVESKLVEELAHTPQIVSCGGGVMTNPLNALIVRQCDGVIVYLQQKFAVCYERIRTVRLFRAIQRKNCSGYLTTGNAGIKSMQLIPFWQEKHRRNLLTV